MLGVIAPVVALILNPSVELYVPVVYAPVPDKEIDCNAAMLLQNGVPT